MKHLLLATLMVGSITAETTLTITEFTLTPISCDDSVQTATFNLVTMGGTAPFFYQLDNQQPTESDENSFTFNNISTPGTHTFTVRDDSSQVQSITSTVGPSDFTKIEGMLTPPCSNDNNGIITLFIEGGTVPLTATLTKADGTTIVQTDVIIPFSFMFEDLRAGDYSIVITSGPVNPNDIAEFIENKYCCPPTVLELTLPNPNPLRIITPIETTPETSGQANGTITVETTGGVTVVYSIDDGETFQESNEFMGLTADTYKLVTRSGIAPIFCFSETQTAVVELQEPPGR